MDVRRSYREAAVRGASPVGLVIRLYEQLIEDLRQIAIAIEKKDIILRTNRIKHAILVAGYLQSSLNFEQGGKVARDLENFYNALRQNLVTQQFHPSRRGVAQIITDVLAVRTAWIQVELAETPQGMVAPRVAHASPDPGAEPPLVDWNG